MTDRELYDKGLPMRREVLGTEYVDRSIANADAFVQPFQKLVTEEDAQKR